MSADWPAHDPLSIRQHTRFVAPHDHASLREAARAAIVDTTAVAAGGGSTAGIVYRILMSEAFQFNPRGEVDASAIWRDRIEAAVSAGQPVRVIYPLMTKIPNFAKQMTGATGATAGELAVIHHFENISETVARVYAPGVEFHILVDGALYNQAIANSDTAVRSYHRGLVQLVADARSRFVHVHDSAELLASEQPREFHSVLHRASRALPEGIENSPDNASWLTSIRASINTLMLPLAFHDLRDLFSPALNPANRWERVVDGHARRALRTMIALKAATNELNLPEKLWPGHIRATCHWKRRGGPVMYPGIRVYPRYYAGSRILPYHGVPLIRLTPSGPQLDFYPEVALRGRRDLARVVQPDGDTWFYEPAMAAEQQPPYGLPA